MGLVRSRCGTNETPSIDTKFDPNFKIGANGLEYLGQYTMRGDVSEATIEDTQTLLIDMNFHTKFVRGLRVGNFVLIYRKL